MTSARPNSLARASAAVVIAFAPSSVMVCLVIVIGPDDCANALEDNNTLHTTLMATTPARTGSNDGRKQVNIMGEFLSARNRRQAVRAGRCAGRCPSRRRTSSREQG